MPAPKREPSSHDSELTMRTDEDGEVLHSNTLEASHRNSLKRRNQHENTTPPRTKMKLCSSEDGDNETDKSFTQSSSPNDSSSTISDPPVKKAKLLKATSASSGEAPPQNTSSQAPLKRAASTDSEDELSSDDSKTDLFRDKSDSDKARCIRKYANRVKGKRRAEDSPSVPQERSQNSQSAPSGTIKMDHNYGRFSDLLGFGDTNLDVRKENVTSVTKGERQELLVSSAQFEPAKTLCSLTLSTHTCIKLKKCATSESKPEDLKDVENQKPTDRTSVASDGEVFHSAAATQVDQVISETANNEKTDHVKSVEIRECTPNESQVSGAEALYSGPREAIQVGNLHSDDRTDLSCASQTELSRETETQETTEEVQVDVKCSNTEAECKGLEVFEETSVPAIHVDIEIDDKAFSNVINCEPEKSQVGSDPLSQTEVNRTAVVHTDTQSDTSVEGSVRLKEESKSEQVPSGLSSEDTLSTSLSHHLVSQPEGNIEESETKDGGTKAAVLPVPSAEVQLNLVVMDKMSKDHPEIMMQDCPAGDGKNQRVLPYCDTDSERQTDTCMYTEVTPEQASYIVENQEIVLPCCDTDLERQTDTCVYTEVTPEQTSCLAENQQRVLPCCDMDSERQTETCVYPEVTLEQTSYLAENQHEENHRICEAAMESEVEGTKPSEQTTRQSAQTEIVEDPSETLEQQVSNQPAPVVKSDATPVFNEDHGSNIDSIESQHQANLEHTTVHEMETLLPKSPSPAPAVEVQSQSASAVGELVTDTSAVKRHDVISETSEVEQNKEMPVFQCTDELEGSSTRIPDCLDVPSALQNQQSPEASESNTSTSEEVKNLISSDVGSVAVDMQEKMTSEDFSSTTAEVETENQQSQNSSDKDRECPEIPTAEGNGNENSLLMEVDSPAKNHKDLEMTEAASAEASDVTDEVVVQVQTNQEVSEVPAYDGAHKDFSVDYIEDGKDDVMGECMDTADTDSQILGDVKITKEEIHHLTPAMKVQNLEEMSHLNIEAQEEHKTESCKSMEENCGFSGESAGHPVAQVNMEASSTSLTSELNSDAPPVAEVQNQGTSEVSSVGTDAANETIENSQDENRPCTQAVDIPEAPVTFESAETVESSNVPLTVKAENQTSGNIGAEPEGHSGDGTPKEDKPATKQNHIPIDTTAAPEKIPQASPAAEFHVHGSLETSELNAKAKENLLTPNCGNMVDQNKSAPECLSLSEAPTSLGSAESLEIVSDLQSAVEEQILKSPKVSKINTGPQSSSTEGEEEEGDFAGAPVDTSETNSNVECTETPETSNERAIMEQQQQKIEEVSEYQVALTDEIRTVVPVAEAQNKNDETVERGFSDECFQRDTQHIRGSIEAKDSGLEKETVIDKAVGVCAHEPDAQATSYPDRFEENVFAYRKMDEVDFGVLSSEEQMKTLGQSEVEMSENQVVYEPISSPESNGDAETPVVSESQEAESFLEMPKTAMQKMEEDPSVFEEGQDVCTQVENEESIEIQAQVPASHDLEMEVQPEIPPGSCVTSNVEQDDTIPDVKQVKEVGSGQDSSVPDESEVAKSESNGNSDFAKAAESPEQEMTGLQEVTGGAVVTAVSNVLVMEDGEAEFVTLEPVPQSEIDFDIVTQAAAESGLSVSYSEEVYHVKALAVTAENKEMLNSSQLVEPMQECQAVDEVEKEEKQSPNQDVSVRDGAIQMFENGEEPAETMEVDPAESNNVANWPGQDTTGQDVNLTVLENNEVDVPVQEVQVLQDMELGHEIVVGITDEEGGSEVCVVEKPQKTSDAEAGEKSAAGAEKRDDDQKAKQDKKPKKQEMNTQARTKARLAALAEQKAAASKRSANKQQLNLLALCQEIAEDIATDSMLLKRIEEEKQAAAAAAAVAAAEAAAKTKASKDEPPATSMQELDPVAPDPPEGGSTPSTTAQEAPAPQVLAAEPNEAKKSAAGAEEPPKRRFFVSQVSVPLKAHEKKKLTRYQRLRQVELQREKMSWARVKKLKSDQANQMASDVDWQAPLHTFSQFSMGPVATEAPPLPPPPPATASQTPPPAKPSVDAPKDNGQTKQTETPSVEVGGSEPAKAAAATAATAKNEPPPAETRKSPRQSRAQAAKETPPPTPVAKVTRSASKRTLPAVPPPMPNGVAAQKKQKPVEYTPYKPRPKYTFDDFELDDDPVPVAPAARPGPPARPPQQARPPTQANLPGRPRPVIPSQLPRPTPPPAGQVSTQSKPTTAASPPPRPSISKTPQSKVVAAKPGAAQATPTAPRPTSSVSAASADSNSCKVTLKSKNNIIAK